MCLTEKDKMYVCVNPWWESTSHNTKLSLSFTVVTVKVERVQRGYWEFVFVVSSNGGCYVNG